MPSQMIPASFVYPFSGPRIQEPPGLTENVGTNWSRLRLVGDVATDIPPNTLVATDQGFLLPASLISRGASLLVSTVGSTISVNGNVVTLYGQKAYKVLDVLAIPQNEAWVDQIGSDEELGGDPNSLYFPVETLSPIPAETCECVLLNQSCTTRHENLNDLVSFSF